MKANKAFLSAITVLLAALVLAAFWELVIEHWLEPSLETDNHPRHLTDLLAIAGVTALIMFIPIRIAFKALGSEEKIEQAYIESEERHRSLIEKSPNGILIHTDGIIRFANPRAVELVGAKSASDMVGMKVHDFIHPDYRDMAIDRMNRLWQGAPAMPLVEMTMLHFDGEPFEAEVYAGQATYEGKPAQQSVFGDISNRKKREKLLSKVAHGLSGTMGKRYLENLTLFLCHTLQTDHAMIGKLNDDRTRVDIQSICSKGQITDNFSYEMKGTPCERVAEGGFCFYGKGVQAKFPDDDLLVEMGIESYIGIPLISTTNKVLGLIALLHSKPITEDRALTDMLQIFSTQVVAELERLEAEAELSKLSRAIEQSINTVIIANPDGVIEYANKTFSDLTGYNLLEVLGKKQFILRPGWKPEGESKDLIDLVRAGREWRGRFKERRKDGKHLWIEVSVSPITRYDGTITHFVTTAQDITDQQQTTEALEASQRLLRAVIDASPALIDAKSKEGHYIFVNKQLARQFKINPADAACYKTSDIYGKKTGSVIEALDQRVFKTGEALQNLETEIEFPDDTARTYLISKAPRFDSHGKVSDIVSISLDITERKKAEAMQDRLLAIIEATPDFIAIIDKLGKLVYVNKSGRRMVGLSDIEPVEKLEIGNFHTPEMTELFLHTGLPKAAETGFWFGETVFLDNKGKRIPTSQVILAHKNDDGDIDYFSTIARDISDRMKSEQALLEAKNAAEAANRSKSEFLANVTHELRTPLNSIIGFSDIIFKEASRSGDHPVFKDYAGDINESGKHLLDLINDILDVSRIEADQMALKENIIDVPKLIRSCQRMIAERAQDAGLNLILDCPDNLPPLKGDERRLKQVLLNLLGNAVKFTASGGTITLSVTLNDDNAYHISVEDTGIGIKKIDFGLIMEPFGQIDSSLRRNQEGVGLGLPLSNSLIKMHGGEIKLESIPHSGSTFTICLPPSRTVLDAREQDIAEPADQLATS